MSRPLDGWRPNHSPSCPIAEMAARPLSGRRVVTTRDRRGALDSRLAANGADVVHVPLISIEPSADDRLATALADLASFDWLVVTSQHGARTVGHAAAGGSVRLAAVGTRTATALERLAGRPVDVVPERQSAGHLAAAMGAHCGRVLVAQADRADRTLVEGLTDHGFDVEAVTAYRTELRIPTWQERQAALSADAVAFASGSAAQAWAEAIGRETPPVVAAIGPTTTAAAEGHGLKVTHVAADHDVEGLVVTVIAALTPSP
jgi:uroporphyrinogen-III synthase